MSSTEAKVRYLTKVLNKNLEKEKAFPLLLHYNYHGVIKPRCELIKGTAKVILLDEIFKLTDEEFCNEYNVTPEELQMKKSEKAQKDEKDILWAYVPTI